MSGPDAGLGPWGEAWVRALKETAMAGAELATARPEPGRASVRGTGGVAGVRVERGRITAYVYDARPRPYRAELRLAVLTPTQWDAFLDTAAEQPAWVAALSDGEIPPRMAARAEEAGARLLPGPGELLPACTCPDRGRPCAHVAALCHEVAGRLDADPFVLLGARGLPKPDLHIRLLRRTRRTRRHESGPDAPDPKVSRSPGAGAGAEAGAGAASGSGGEVGADRSGSSGEAGASACAGTANMTGKEAARAAARRARAKAAEADGRTGGADTDTDAGEGVAGASASRAGARKGAVGTGESAGDVADSRSDSRSGTGGGRAGAQAARLAVRRARTGASGDAGAAPVRPLDEVTADAGGAGPRSRESGGQGPDTDGTSSGTAPKRTAAAQAAREAARRARRERRGSADGAGVRSGAAGAGADGSVRDSGRGPVRGSVPAREALATSVRPPLPAPLPVPDAPGEPGPFPDVPDGPSADALAFLATDAAARAHRALTAHSAHAEHDTSAAHGVPAVNSASVTPSTSATPSSPAIHNTPVTHNTLATRDAPAIYNTPATHGTAAANGAPAGSGAFVGGPLAELSLEHDIIRLAATHPQLTGRRTLSPLFAGLARTAGYAAPQLARVAAAWRQGEEVGLTVLEGEWDPPAGDFDRARSTLAAAGISVTIRRNRLTHTTRLLQLRYGPDGRWYPYRADGEDGEWWPEGPSAADPLTALSGILGEE